MVTTDKSIRHSEAKMTANNSKSSIILLAAAIVVAFLLRMLPYAAVTANGGITFRGFDDFYHMRLIAYTVSNFPHSLNFDSYINYPYGYNVGWPPFFDLLGALLAKVLGGGQPDLHTTEFAGALLPVLLGVITIVPLYIVSAAVLDKKTGVLAAFIFAVLPAHISVSRFGLVDHHVAEALLTTASYALFILALKSAREGSISIISLKNISSERKVRESLAFAMGSGLFLALLIYTWIGAPAFVSLIALYAFIQATINLKDGKQSDDVFICSITCLFATLLFTIPLAAGSIRKGLEMSALYLSWFQVFYVLIMIIGIALLWGISNYISKKELDWKYYPGVLILIVAAGFLALSIFFSTSYSFVLAGINFFFGKGEYMGTISEALPLFLTAQGGLNLGSAYWAFGLCLLAALGALLLLILERDGAKSKSEGIFFLVWSVFSIYLALSQQRFSYQLAINVSILTSYMLWILLESFDFEAEIRKLVKLEQKNGKNISSTLQAGKEIKLNTKSKMKSKNTTSAKKTSVSSNNSKKPDYFKIVSSLALIGIVFVPCLWTGSVYASSGTLYPAWQESLNWLKNSSPQTSNYQQPTEIPEYGVLSWWDYGNWIVYLSERPAVSNNFQTNVDETARFFINDSEKEAKAILDKFKVKYVITDSLMLAANAKFSSIVQIAGKNSGNYYDVSQQQTGAGIKTTVAPKRELLNLELFKLQNLDGSNLGNLRLVHESYVPPGVDARNITVKVFEYVPGARISGTAKSNQTVIALIGLKSNTGRQFIYQNKAVSDSNGSFEITVPYSTENKSNGVSAITAYALKVEGNNNSTVSGIQVKESDILNGSRLEVKLP
ncbi:MAG: dolichyl-phosphooligosaccharide-protein glycotransferase [Euryarchaeota archaeon]|nr:dolichyl-phosphooligosaccharide-protein glycotransferase [Euryarchaeota archaeon]